MTESRRRPNSGFYVLMSRGEVVPRRLGSIEEVSTVKLIVPF